MNQLVITYSDNTVMYYPVERGWRVDNADRCLVIGRFPRTYIPLDSVRSFTIERVEDVRPSADLLLPTAVEEITGVRLTPWQRWWIVGGTAKAAKRRQRAHVRCNPLFCVNPQDREGCPKIGEPL